MSAPQTAAVAASPQTATDHRPKQQAPSFVQMPDGLDVLSPNAFRLYYIMLSYIRPGSGKTECYPALETLRERMGRPRPRHSASGRRPSVDLKTVLRARKELEEAGLVIIVQRGNGHPRWRKRRDDESDDDRLENHTIYRLTRYVREGVVMDERPRA